MAGLGTGGPPNRIPDTRDLALDYEEISDGDRLGQGGNADVTLSRVRRGDREVAVAVKRPRFQGTIRDETVERFTDEVEIWEGVDDHDHVVGVLDWGTGPLPWLAMEYMDGGSLADLLADGRLPVDQAVWVGLCVSRAVRHAHRHGVAHHDIKPSNVLFRDPESGWLVPKVSDWGLARVLLDETGSVDGLSPQYAAPEQFDADQFGSPDDFTDVYQVGTLLYECLTGRPPFEGSPAAVMGSVLSERPDPPSAVADVPSRVDDVVMPALRTAKEDRYDAIVYLRDELEALFEDCRGEANTSRTLSSGPTGAGWDTTPGEPPGTGVESESEAGEEAGEDGEDGDRDGLLTRRAALGGLGLGVLGVGAGAGGYLLVDPFGGTRDQPSAWKWLPEPELVTGADVLPFHVVQPAGSVTHYERYPDPITGVFQSFPPGDDHLSLPLSSVESAVAASRLRVATGEFDSDALARTLESEGFEDGGEYGRLSIVTGPDERMAVGLSNGAVLVGHHTPEREATTLVKSAVDASRGDATQYVEAGAKPFEEAVSDPEFAFWRPVEGSVDDPDQGLFASERGYGSVAEFGSDAVSIEYVRAFERSPDDETLSAVEENWPVDGETTVADGTVRLAFDGPADEPGVFNQLTPVLRSTDPGTDVDVGIDMFQFDFTYELDGERYQSFPGPVEPDTEYTVALRSRDVVHGLSIEPLGVERAVAPGEQRVFSFAVGESDLTFRGSRYAGAGTRHMEEEIAVSSGDTVSPEVEGYLSDVDNYDGVVDRTGQSEVTVAVGAGDDGLVFDPPAIQVDPGTTVTWEWTGVGGAHNVVAEDGTFESELVSEDGHVFEHTVEESDTSLYFCEPHKSIGMKGVVVVET